MTSLLTSRSVVSIPYLLSGTVRLVRTIHFEPRSLRRLRNWPVFFRVTEQHFKEMPLQVLAIFGKAISGMHHCHIVDKENVPFVQRDAYAVCSGNELHSVNRIKLRFCWRRKVGIALLLPASYSVARKAQQNMVFTCGVERMAVAWGS